MVGKTSKNGVVFADEENNPVFKCANTGFLIDERVFFPYDLLQANNAVTLLNNLSFKDWNNAVSYIRDLTGMKELKFQHRIGLEEYVNKLNGLTGSNANISMPPNRNRAYPNNPKSGLGPNEFSNSYESLTAGKQTIQEYFAWAATANPPKVLTPEQEANKLKTLQSLKSRTNLNFEVRIPATQAEIDEEDQRVREIEEKERKMKEEADAAAAAPPTDGKSKLGKRKTTKTGLTSKEKSRKRRRIASDKTRSLSWVSGETDSAALLSNLLGDPLPADGSDVSVSLSLSQSEWSTCLAITNPRTLQKVYLHLPPKM
jgi:hypothetical protein